MQTSKDTINSISQPPFALLTTPAKKDNSEISIPEIFLFSDVAPRNPETGERKENIDPSENFFQTASFNNVISELLQASPSQQAIQSRYESIFNQVPVVEEKPEVIADGLSGNN